MTDYIYLLKARRQRRLDPLVIHWALAVLMSGSICAVTFGLLWGWL